MAGRQVAGLGRPVVHLQVDVGVVVGVPRRVDVLVPDPLQVGRQRARPTRAEQQVAAELEPGRQQVGVGATLPDLRQPFVGRQLAQAAAAEVEVHAVERHRVLGDLAAVQVAVADRGRLAEREQRCQFGGHRLHRDGAAGRLLGQVVVGRRGEHERHRVGVEHPQFGRTTLDGVEQPAAAMQHLHRRRERDPLVRLVPVGLALHHQERVVALDLGTFAAGQPRLHVDGALAVGGDVHDQAVVRHRREHLAGVGHVGDLVGGRGDAGAQVQAALVVGHLLVPRERQQQVAERLVAANPALGQELALHQLLGGAVVPVEQQRARPLQVPPRAFAVALHRLARPQRIDVQLDAFGRRPAEHHRAEPAVADRQRVGPAFGGSAIPELRRVHLRDHDRRKQGDHQRGDPTHPGILDAGRRDVCLPWRRTFGPRLR